MGRDARSNIRSHEFNRPLLPALVRDLLGRTLGVGDLVILQPGGGHITWSVAEIRRELDPRAPANTVKVTVSCTISMHATTGQAVPMILVVPQAELPQPEPVAENPQAEDNGGPSLVITDAKE